MGLYSTRNWQLLAFLGYSSPCTTHTFIRLQTRFSQHQVFHLSPDLLPFAALGKQSSGDGCGKRGLQNVHLTAPALWTVKQQVAVKMVTANNVIPPNPFFIRAKHCFSWRVSGSRQWFWHPSWISLCVGKPLFWTPEDHRLHPLPWCRSRGCQPVSGFWPSAQPGLL